MMLLYGNDITGDKRWLFVKAGRGFIHVEVRRYWAAVRL